MHLPKWIDKKKEEEKNKQTNCNETPETRAKSFSIDAVKTIAWYVDVYSRSFFFLVVFVSCNIIRALQAAEACEKLLSSSENDSQSDDFR